MALRVGPVEDSGWVEFARSMPDALAFHHPAWMQVLADSYGYRPMAAVLEEDGQIKAGMPLMAFRRLGRRRLVSLPYTDHCPPLARDSNALQAFAHALREWQAGRPRIPVEVRAPLGDGIPSKVVAVRHVLPLQRAAEEAPSRPSSAWARGVRKAEREGLEVRMTESADALEDFYRLHCMTRKRLGVPVQPRRFFDHLWRRVIEPGFGFLLLAQLGGRSVAGAVLLGWKGTLVYKYAASDPAFLPARPNNLVCAAAIEWGGALGYQYLDFGRSDLRDKGLRAFKQGSGAREEPLAYSYIGESPHDTVNSHARRLMSRFIKAAPPAFGRAVGSLLYGHFG